jgi:dephospho-CoA kinase
MSAWPGKYVIGLTGNIATGKSVVRKMLEHLGAYGIDADALTHRALAKDAPGYQPVVETFGSWILGPDRQIDRARLGRIVFADPLALASLEAIVHPLVRQAVDVLVRRSRHTVIVIEAIKLLESPLRQNCDTIIVAHASPAVQLSRLIQKRGMTEEAARQRIRAQDPQKDKISQADIVIRNDGTFDETWRQVVKAWQKIVPISVQPAPHIAVAPPGEMVVIRARPQDAKEIAAFMQQVSSRARYNSRDEVMAAFGEKAFLLLKSDSRVLGLVGWQVENLVARTSDAIILPGVPLADSMRLLLEEVESASRDLQCEVSLLFLPPNLARKEEVWRSLGYEPRTIPSLGVRAWQEAASESMPVGTVLLFKQLRKDRVLRPV